MNRPTAPQKKLRWRRVILIATAVFVAGLAWIIVLLVYDAWLKQKSLITLVSIVSAPHAAATAADPHKRLGQLLDLRVLRADQLRDPRTGRPYGFVVASDDSVRSDDVLAYSPLCDSPVEWVYRLTGRSGRGGCVLYADGHGEWLPEAEYERTLAEIRGREVSH